MEFIQFYEAKFFATATCLRKFMKSELLKDPAFTSKVANDVNIFLKSNTMPEPTREHILLAVSEFISNTEHNDGDCLLDINIHDNFINISFINLFDGRMFDELRMKHQNNALLASAYDIIDKAYCYHSLHFNEKYNQDDFYFISAFQASITTRARAGGGTGLTHVINSIANETLNAHSYVLSGHNLIHFLKGYLGNGNKVVGFNENNDYYQSLPSEVIIDRCSLYIPGVVFQLIIEI